MDQAVAPMNLLMITGIFPPDIGGPATYVPTMASELVKRGHKVTVVTLSDRLDHDDRSYNFPVHRIRRGLFKPLRFLFTVLRILREGRGAQVLYVNGLYLEAVIANYLLRKPMVQKIVGDWAWERSTNKGWVKDNFEEFQKRKYRLKVELLKSLRTFCTRRADTMIAPSQYLARAVADWGLSEKKIIVVYNAVEAQGSVPAKIPLQTPFKIVTVGRLIALKQVDQLIRAITNCSEAGLVIIGDGPERKKLEGLVIEHGLGPRVHFTGQRSNGDTLALMAACDLFVLNSTHEGFPYVLLEAMSVGLPIVATAVGGIPELVRDGANGVLISPNANGMLAKTLLEIMSAPEARRRFAGEAKRTAKRFAQSAMIEKTEGVLSRANELT